MRNPGGFLGVAGWGPESGRVVDHQVMRSSDVIFEQDCYPI
jgi:hypothetical protein